MSFGFLVLRGLITQEKGGFYECDVLITVRMQLTGLLSIMIKCCVCVLD